MILEETFYGIQVVAFCLIQAAHPVSSRRHIFSLEQEHPKENVCSREAKEYKEVVEFKVEAVVVPDVASAESDA